MTEEQKRMRAEQITGYEATRNTWFWMYMRWLWVHYTLAVLALVCSAIVAGGGKTNFHLWSLNIELKIVVVILTGTIALFSAEKQASQAQRAWRVLSVATTRFLNEETYTLDNFLTAYEQGEDILHDAQPNNTTGPHQPQQHQQQKS
jgi:hypothetical protein